MTCRFVTTKVPEVLGLDIRMPEPVSSTTPRPSVRRLLSICTTLGVMTFVILASHALLCSSGETSEGVSYSVWAACRNSIACKPLFHGDENKPAPSAIPIKSVPLKNRIRDRFDMGHPKLNGGSIRIDRPRVSTPLLSPLGGPRTEIERFPVRFCRNSDVKSMEQADFSDYTQSPPIPAKPGAEGPYR